MPKHLPYTRRLVLRSGGTERVSNGKEPGPLLGLMDGVQPVISDPLFPGVRIFAVAARFPSHLVITWTDGVTRLVDVGDALRGHTLLDMLNIPEVFVDVEVINRGAGIGWANGADFCAHALRMKSDEQELAKSKVVAT